MLFLIIQNQALFSYLMNGEAQKFHKFSSSDPVNGVSITADYDTSGNLKQSYINGLSIDSKVGSIQPNGTVSYYIPDHLGSVHRITDSAGNIQNTYITTAFGEPILTQEQITNNRYGFTQRENNVESNTQHLRRRTFDQRTGRFMQKDPVLSNRVSSSYAYARNNPLKFTDPWGRDVVAWFDGIHVDTPDSVHNDPPKEANLHSDNPKKSGDDIFLYYTYYSKAQLKEALEKAFKTAKEGDKQLGVAGPQPLRIGFYNHQSWHYKEGGYDENKRSQARKWIGDVLDELVNEAAKNGKNNITVNQVALLWCKSGNDNKLNEEDRSKIATDIPQITGKALDSIIGFTSVVCPTPSGNIHNAAKFVQKDGELKRVSIELESDFTLSSGAPPVMREKEAYYNFTTGKISTVEEETNK